MDSILYHCSRCLIYVYSSAPNCTCTIGNALTRVENVCTNPNPFPDIDFDNGMNNFVNVQQNNNPFDREYSQNMSNLELNVSLSDTFAATRNLTSNQETHYFSQNLQSSQPNEFLHSYTNYSEISPYLTSNPEYFPESHYNSASIFQQPTAGFPVPQTELRFYTESEDLEIPRNLQKETENFLDLRDFDLSLENTDAFNVRQPQEYNMKPQAENIGKTVPQTNPVLMSFQNYSHACGAEAKSSVLHVPSLHSLSQNDLDQHLHCHQPAFSSGHQDTSKREKYNEYSYPNHPNMNTSASTVNDEELFRWIQDVVSHNQTFEYQDKTRVSEEFETVTEDTSNAFRVLPQNETRTSNYSEVSRNDDRSAASSEQYENRILFNIGEAGTENSSTVLSKRKGVFHGSKNLRYSQREGNIAPNQNFQSDLQETQNLELKANIRNQTESKERPYFCNVCPKTFKTKHIRNCLIRNPTKKRTYPCHLCSKIFTGKSNLEYHIRTHTNERPFECHICSKRFTGKGNLASHIRTHTNDRPYRCKICPKKYRHKTNLSYHLLSHTNELPFHCSICSRRLKSRTQLNYHMLSHTIKRPYRCHICDKSFKRKLCLSQHTKIHLNK